MIMTEIVEVVSVVLGFAYKLFKFIVILSLITAFCFSAQCQEAINEICITTNTCEPNFERVEFLRGK